RDRADGQCRRAHAEGDRRVAEGGASALRAPDGTSVRDQGRGAAAEGPRLLATTATELICGRPTNNLHGPGIAFCAPHPLRGAKPPTAWQEASSYLGAWPSGVGEAGLSAGEAGLPYGT